MAMTDPREIAADIARELREHPERWTQHQYARLPKGGGCEPDDPEAAKWCLLGMIRKRFAKRSQFYECINRFRMQMTKGIPDFNDDPRHTVQDVIALCERIAKS